MNDQHCIECGEDTSFGHGKFVNRVPADDGYLCADCLSFECDSCGELIEFDCEIRDNGAYYCEGCAEKLGVKDHGI